ncbi:protein Lst7p [Trichomonascus vanleenenianus]|uniref:Lst7p n=1 Tax=Trichomonascus vanleenenianus TaxID=2268995 RepID=UPI003ECA9FE3
MMCFAHFCEVHGPTSVLTTQALSSATTVASEIPIGCQHQTCQSCELVFPSDVRAAQCIRTSGDDGTVYLSSQYPATDARFKAIRQSCLRTLSSEYTFNERTPMMFSDPQIGTAIVLVFHVDDGSSRGHVRKYAIICLGENETQLVKTWDVVVPQMEQLASSIRLRALLESDKENAKKTGHERFLRNRDAKQQPKSLATILKDDRVFVEIHARFTKMLYYLCRGGVN